MKITIPLRDLKEHLGTGYITIEQIQNALAAQNPDLSIQLEANMKLTSNLIEALSNAFDEEEGELEIEIAAHSRFTGKRPRAEGFGNEEDIESIAEKILTAIDTPLVSEQDEPIGSFRDFEREFFSYVNGHIDYKLPSEVDPYRRAAEALVLLQDRVVLAFPEYRSIIESCMIEEVRNVAVGPLLDIVLLGFKNQLSQYLDRFLEYTIFYMFIDDFRALPRKNMTIQDYDKRVELILGAVRENAKGNDILVDEILQQINIARNTAIITEILEQINNKIFKEIKKADSPPFSIEDSYLARINEGEKKLLSATLIYPEPLNKPANNKEKKPISLTRRIIESKYSKDGVIAAMTTRIIQRMKLPGAEANIVIREEVAKMLAELKESAHPAVVEKIQNIFKNISEKNLLEYLDRAEFFLYHPHSPISPDRLKRISKLEQALQRRNKGEEEGEERGR